MRLRHGRSGTRIKLSFFGGAQLPSDPESARVLVERGYRLGVPVGADLVTSDSAPRFTMHATKDPDGANLDRIQIIKGWLDREGNTHERSYDVAWGNAGKRTPGNDGKLPPVGDTVDVDTASWTNTIGDPDLRAVWTDPDFDAGQPAFYYARVIEIPTPRWTPYDQKRFGIKMPPEVPMKTRERAWTSPIWYQP